MSVVRKRYPDLQPRRILDLGCGPGLETIALKEAFPDAEVHALDLSEPFVRFGHAWAEDRGLPMHFRQADAQRTGYPDGHFDLIVSHILFHETWHDIAPRIFAEAHRILAPGGVFLNADVPYQPARMSIPKQVTNDWQVRNNGEPFWTGFADTDVPAAAGARRVRARARCWPTTSRSARATTTSSVAGAPAPPASGDAARWRHERAAPAAPGTPARRAPPPAPTSRSMRRASRSWSRCRCGSRWR